MTIELINGDLEFDLGDAITQGGWAIRRGASRTLVAEGSRSSLRIGQQLFEALSERATLRAGFFGRLGDHLDHFVSKWRARWNFS